MDEQTVGRCGCSRQAVTVVWLEEHTNRQQYCLHIICEKYAAQLALRTTITALCTSTLSLEMIHAAV